MGLSSRLIILMENKLGQPLDYLRDIATASPAAFYEFLMFMPFAGHRKAAPTDGYFLASIGALQHEDCGPCLQIVVDQAIAAGVPESSISAALAGGSTLAPDRKLFLDFGRAVAANAPEAEELRMRLAEQLPAGAMVDLAIVVAASRVFPTLKRGLGRAQSCSIVRVTVAGRDAA